MAPILSLCWCTSCQSAIRCSLFGIASSSRPSDLSLPRSSNLSWSFFATRSAQWTPFSPRWFESLACCTSAARCAAAFASQTVGGPSAATGAGRTRPARRTLIHCTTSARSSTSSRRSPVAGPPPGCAQTPQGSCAPQRTTVHTTLARLTPANLKDWMETRTELGPVVSCHCRSRGPTGQESSSTSTAYVSSVRPDGVTVQLRRPMVSSGVSERTSM
mmetsp:Transcript_147119/g.409856  ORF Transcript_147119/g.409856 Transcript_147119/m.409856 type:complete len:217 (+) Transcript_147119:200-850(+)